MTLAAHQVDFYPSAKCFQDEESSSSQALCLLLPSAFRKDLVASPSEPRMLQEHLAFLASNHRLLGSSCWAVVYCNFTVASMVIEGEEVGTCLPESWACTKVSFWVASCHSQKKA